MTDNRKLAKRLPDALLPHALRRHAEILEAKGEKLDLVALLHQAAKELDAAGSERSAVLEDQIEEAYAQLAKCYRGTHDPNFPFGCINVLYTAALRGIKQPNNAATDSERNAVLDAYIEFYNATEAARILPWYKDGRNDAEREAAWGRIEAAVDAIRALKQNVKP